MSYAKLFVIGMLPVMLALSGAPPAAHPQVRNGELIWFLLNETRDVVAQALGRPALVADFGQDFQSWQYQMGEIDRHEFSHQLVFRKATGTLISVTLNYSLERNVDELFPEAMTTTHHYRNEAGTRYSLRLRRLPDGRALMAMGTSKAGQPTGQLVLVREAELRYFYPWLHTVNKEKRD